MLEQKVQRAPTYDLEAVQPMRDELVAVGFEDLRTAQDIDKVVGETTGTLLVMINSVCGCAAGSARPGVALALQHHVIPDRLVTVFAGMEHDAVERVRALHVGYPPSSPSLVLLQGRQVWWPWWSGAGSKERPRSNSPATSGSSSPVIARGQVRRFPHANSPSSNSPRSAGPPFPDIEATGGGRALGRDILRDTSGRPRMAPPACVNPFGTPTTPQGATKDSPEDGKPVIAPRRMTRSRTDTACRLDLT